MQIWNLRQILGHIGYFRVCSGTRRPKLRVSIGQSRTFGVRARSDGFDTAKPKSTRKPDQKYTNLTKSHVHDPEFDADSKSAIKTMLDARNLELQLPIETAGKASRLGIPTRQKRTDIRTRHRILTQKTQTCTRGTPYGENEPQWLNSFFFGKPGMKLRIATSHVSFASLARFIDGASDDTAPPSGNLLKMTLLIGKE